MSFVLAVTWVAKPGEGAAVERILRTKVSPRLQSRERTFFEPVE